MCSSDVLLQRISDIWESQELSDKDIRSLDVTQNFRDLCTLLCAAILQHKDCLPAGSSVRVKAAVYAVLRCASSEIDSKKIEKAMVSLNKALDPQSTAQARTDVLERIVAAVQALRLLSMSAQSDEATGTTKEFAEKSDDQGLVLPHAVEVSQQLSEIARLLEVDSHTDSAMPLLLAVNERLPQMFQVLPASFFSPLLPQKDLTADQMAALAEVETDLRQEYRVRRQMLIERAKVLMQSFMRADRLKEESLAQEAKSLANTHAEALRVEPELSLSDVFSARQADLVALSSKASSGANFKASVKQLNIGAVPNRGGIPSDHLKGLGQPGSTAPGRDFHKNAGGNEALCCNEQLLESRI